jgi:hypothetical protein
MTDQAAPRCAVSASSNPRAEERCARMRRCLPRRTEPPQTRGSDPSVLGVLREVRSRHASQASRGDVVTPTTLMPCPATSSRRVCSSCVAALTGLRRDARVCSGPCRAALSRVRLEEPIRRFWTSYALVKRPTAAHRRTRSPHLVGSEVRAPLPADGRPDGGAA